MAEPPWQDSPPVSAIGAIVRHFITRREGDEIYRQLRRHWLPNQQVLYDNLPHDAVQAWADAHAMQTFASSMGRLIDPADPRCPRASKSAQQWSDYIHGASVIFCWLISLHDEVTVLLEPRKTKSAGDDSRTGFYSTVQEPIVTGRMGDRSVKWLHVVQPTVRGAANYSVVIRSDKTHSGSNGLGALMSHLHDKLVGRRRRERTRTTMTSGGYEPAAESSAVKSRHRTRMSSPLGEKGRGEKSRGEKSRGDKGREDKGREKYRGEKSCGKKHNGKKSHEEKSSKRGHAHTKSTIRKGGAKQEDRGSREKPRKKPRSHGKQEGTSPRSGSTHKHRHKHRHKKRHKSWHLVL